ncbi:MAG: hypothetical protein HW416_821 [Chloroflexi bacterium]|nr:hypothetical protein [Chloroflexota bacterium]
MAAQRLTVGLGYRYDSAYLRDRVVQVHGFDVEFKPDLAPSGAGQRYVAPASMFESMASDPPYDVGELAFATYVQAVDQGKDFTAIPVFTSRYFEHGQLFVRRDGPIRSPRDLEGRRVGIGCFSVNPAVWLRGTLTHQYDVATERITWVTNRREYFPEFQVPRRYSVESAPEGKSFGDLAAAGGIDAVSRSGSTDALRPLFENPYPEIAQYYEQNGIFPINTVLMLPKRTIEKAAGFVDALFDAFRRALDLYREDVRRGAQRPDHSGLDLLRLEREAGVSLPDHGMSANKQNIRMMVQYCYEQGVIRRLYEPEELFVLHGS